MLRRLSLFICAVMATAVYAQTPDQVVNEVMQTYMQKNEVPGVAVMLYIDGKPSAYYYGYADRETKKPVTKDTIFELGSITKVLTTLLLAQEVDFAKIKLKEPITKYLPTLPVKFTNITVRSLATHTSGLPFKAPADIKNRVQWEKYAETLTPEHAQDESYVYSNVGIGVLGQAIEKVTHQSFNQLYRTKILAPLGMQQIGLTVPEKLKEFYARGYNIQGVAVPPEADGLFPAAGDAKASADDMSKFLSASIGLPPTPVDISYPMMMTQSAYVEIANKNTEQGLGWQIHAITTSEKIKALLVGSDTLGLKTFPVEKIITEPVFNGSALIDKTGSTTGFKDYIAVIPGKKTGIVILTNRNISGDALLSAGREILFKLNDIS